MAEQTVTVNYSGAVNAALRRCLAELPETLLYGEDVAKPGGVHGVTRGLWKEFGDRVSDTPISESAILGSAVGAAMMGRRPIVEIMWADFFLVALDQMVNQAANIRYVSAGRLARAPGGAHPAGQLPRRLRPALTEPGSPVPAHARAAGGDAVEPAGRLRHHGLGRLL